MKRASEHAKRVKQLYQQLVRKHGKPDPHQFTSGHLNHCSGL